MGRIILAFQVFWRILFNREFALRVQPLVAPPTEPARNPQALPAASLLSILQRDGRLLDFLMESIEGFPDARIGAVARTVHQGCRKALQEYVKVEPVLSQAEGSSITVDAGFDPSAIRVMGNVTGNPPFKGALRHHGWRLADVSLPVKASGQDTSIIMPAEVEI